MEAIKKPISSKVPLKRSDELVKILEEIKQAKKFYTIAGPCSVENEGQIHRIATLLASVGVRLLRGGAFKPRTSPYAFQGIGKLGYKLLADAALANNMYSVSEVMSEAQLDLALDFIDIFQVGARNMQNYALLKLLGKTQKPILLKRGLCATYDELINAAEYIKCEGNSTILLCERGIRTFESYTRNTLDILAIPALKELASYPVIIDPSHAAGKRSLVLPISYAAVAAGANGLIIEVHDQPELAKSDASQALPVHDFLAAVPKFQAIWSILN